VQILCGGENLIDFAKLVSEPLFEGAPAGSVCGLISAARVATIANDSPFCESRRNMKKLETTHERGRDERAAARGRRCCGRKGGRCCGR